MFTKTSIPFKNAEVLKKLSLNYLENNINLKPFFSFYPNLKGFEELIKTNPYSTFDRENLYQILLKQSNFSKNTSKKSFENIKKLKEKKSYTITTGHQLCLFTGPLYFIYKILTTVNLSEKLKKEFPDFNFIPIYWMASEDHDFEEINNFNVFDKKVNWVSDQKGAVGDFNTIELQAVYAQISEIFGTSENAVYLLQLFKNSYLNHHSLKEATRFLINELFGEYGLVIADGNDKKFKEQFKEQFKSDFFENMPFKKVKESIDDLKKLGYNAQVNPRAINSFYLEKNNRLRIEKKESVYNLIGTERNLTKIELEELIENQSEKISPNVILRPLYQQTILPNICYVGGPAEISYWLELKKMFDHFNTTFPIIMPRNFISIIDKATDLKIKKLKLKLIDVYKPENELINHFLSKLNVYFNLDLEKEEIIKTFESVTKKIDSIDKTLEKKIEAELQKIINSLDVITEKANKSLKQKLETEINQIKSIILKLFPNKLPQEREVNFCNFYIKYGPDFFKHLKKEVEPFISEPFVLTEN